MAEKFTLQHRGRRYEVERGQPRRQAATETPAALRARIHRWLDEQPEPLGGEGIYLGGG